jgi:membrane-associated phospholipid phosphatase
MLSFSQIDTSLLLNINSFLIGNGVALKIIDEFANNPLLRGLPIFFMLVTLWFLPNPMESRSRIFVGLLTACFVTAVSVSLQFHFTPHIRPLLDSSIRFNFIKFSANNDHWGRMGSFPSDTATLFFSLGAIIFIENRRAGTFCLLWALLTTGIARIALGYHYPSDIAGAFVLGFGSILLISRASWPKAMVAHVFKQLLDKEYIVHSFYFILLADAYSLFPGLQSLYHGLKKFIF